MRNHGSTAGLRVGLGGVALALSLAIELFVGGIGSATAGPSGAQTRWGKFRYDASNDGFNPFETKLGIANVGTLTKKWSHAHVATSPSVSGGSVFVGTFHVNTGFVTAFDARTGRQRWSTMTSDIGSSTPTVADGMVFVGTYDGYHDGSLYALNASTGAIEWSSATEDSEYSAPVVADGTVFGGEEAQDFGDGNVYAIREATGKPVWTFYVRDFVRSSPAVSGGTVVVGSQKGYVYALDESTGRLQWKYRTGGEVNSSPALFGGTILVGSDDRKLYALSGGAELWSFRTGAAFGFSSPALDTGSGTVYIATDKVYALDASTGELKWATSGCSAGSPTIANGVVYVGASCALDASTGDVLWSSKGAGMEAAVANGRVYVTDHYRVEALGLR